MFYCLIYVVRYKMKWAFILSVFLFSATSVVAQGVFRSFSSIRFSKRDFADTVKVKVIDGAVIVPVEIAGSVRNLLFDTGAQSGFWIRLDEEWMNLAEADSLNVMDINENRKKRASYVLPPVKLGGLVIENYSVVAADGMRNYLCDMFDGAMGFDLVGRGLSFKLDTKDSLLIVTDIKGFFAAEEQGRPYVKYKLVNKSRPVIDVEMPFGTLSTIFDTGAMRTWVQMSQRMLDNWLYKHPKKREEVDALTVQMDSTINTNIGLFGLKKDTMVERFIRFPSLSVGGLRFEDLYLSTACNGSRVGAAVLNRTSLIIDAQKKKFVFMPHDGSSVITVGNDGLGSISFVPTEQNDTLGVLKAVVRKGGAAYLKGVRTGDYLLEADGTPITDICTYVHLDRRNSAMSFKFRSPDGTLKHVVLERTF